MYVHGHADMIEQATLDRADLGASPASVMAVREALRVAGIGVDDIATFDLYSCFPFPVFVICEALGIDGDDPRGLTLTGGLPYFGGPGNSYSLHGIAETVSEMREAARAIRLCRRQRRHHEQVLGRHLLHRRPSNGGPIAARC